MNAQHVPLRQIVVSIEPEMEQRRGGARRELKKRGRGMKDRVDKSMGIVTLIAEALAKINPTEPFRFAKRAARKKRKCSDSSGNSAAKILALRCACKKNRQTKS
jgi:hypothetical protein